MRPPRCLHGLASTPDGTSRAAALTRPFGGHADRSDARQNESDVIVAINDVPVRGKDGGELAGLVHDGKRWYSGLPGISTLTVRSAGHTRLQVRVHTRL